MVIKLGKVLISDEVDPKCVQILQNNNIEVVKNTKLSAKELVSEIAKYDGLIVRSATKVTADVINAATNLKIIGRAGTGVDNIDTDAATKRGIIVMNTPGGNTLSAAEHTCTLIIGLTRRLGAADKSMKEGKWDRKQFMGSELNGKTLGIIGLGRIGKEVALRMQAFGMTTIGYDPFFLGDVSATFNTEWVELKEIWARSDYITVHTPLIPSTKNLLNDDVFAQCKKGVKVVNCARGGIIDEAALLRALESGQCGGAGLDVFIEEPPKDFTLAKHEKVIATPHLGASTIEAQTRVAEEIAQQFVDLVQGKSSFGAINASALTNALSPSSQPWVSLGQKLGVISVCLSNSQSPVSVQVTVSGNCLEKATSYLQAAVLAGCFKAVNKGDNHVNLINSSLLAQQAGIKTTSTHVDGMDTASVKVELQYNGRESMVVCGTVEGCQPKLTSIQGLSFDIPAVLEGHIVLYQLDRDISVGDIIGAVIKDGGQVSAFASSEVVNSKSFGVVNLARPCPNSLGNLNGLASKCVAVSL